MEIKPLVKWVGGKRQLLPVISKCFPPKFNKYFEPFVGGGAIFFHLQPKKAVIADINLDLITTYLMVKNKVDELIASLDAHTNTEDHYYEVRDLNPQTLPDVERASRFIFLNHTCFNGLYRENSKGQFNVAFGKYKNPKVYDKSNLKSISEYFRNNEIEILHTDYKETLKSVGEGDFVYLDPPYYPINLDSFTKYNKTKFLEKEQVELFHEFDRINKSEAYVILSNSNTDFIKNLYRRFELTEVVATRNINRNGSGRKAAAVEVIVRNFLVC